MIRNLRLLICLTLLIYPFFSLQAASVLAVDYGYSLFEYDPMTQYEVKPQGPGFGITFGSRLGMLESEFFFRSFEGSADFIHDDVQNSFIHEQKTYGLAFKFYLSKQFFLRFGYLISKIDQDVENEVVAYRQENINRLYSVIHKGTSNGPLYGLGFNFFDGKRWDVFTMLTRSHVYDDATETSVSIGLKFYFNLGFKSVFSF